ncbi:MAG TPA: Hsp20/alpha crystallin family protein [Phycisphaerae bacterium]|jgi:HSP20 family molecular chaperone IbpA|nr:Hsp20/alpha crystallin family protein [Phycisphaerae bacterium]HPM23078.1 Hsp20/alpha crystallin family protein [Phycisphaerae bacterium]HQL53596.1 Hsp20/alpha crystallin family protein [Phycisphaerae bacterium]
MGAKKFGQDEDMRDWSRRIQDIMDEMRNRSFCDYRATGTWLPTVNIYETRSTYYVCVELAGLESSSVTVECPDARHISVAGERMRPRLPDLVDPFSVELMEIDEGPFHREIDFGQPFEANTLEVSYDQGYLWITLRKTATT